MAHLFITAIEKHCNGVVHLNVNPQDLWILAGLETMFHFLLNTIEAALQSASHAERLPISMVLQRQGVSTNEPMVHLIHMYSCVLLRISKAMSKSFSLAKMCMLVHMWLMNDCYWVCELPAPVFDNAKVEGF